MAKFKLLFNIQARDKSDKREKKKKCPFSHNVTGDL